LIRGFKPLRPRDTSTDRQESDKRILASLNRGLFRKRWRHSDFLLGGANLSRVLIGRRKSGEISSQDRILAAKIEFSYGAGRTVNLLALRLQWFESTPAHASF